MVRRPAINRSTWTHAQLKQEMAQRVVHVVRSLEDECWEWSGPWGLQKGRNYGRYATQGVFDTQAAHRISWALEHDGVMPDNLVCHRCDNPPCIRPSHLFVGSHQDNVRDMVQKGRANSSFKPGDDHIFRRSPEVLVHYQKVRMKVQADQYPDILEKLAAGIKCTALAAEYAVSYNTMQTIIEVRIPVWELASQK